MATLGNKGPNLGALEKLKISSSSLPPIKSSTIKSPPNYLSPTSRIRIAGGNHRYSTSDDDSGCVMDEYAWVPSGLKPDIVHQYFSRIPDDRIPYINSPGEKWRNFQLQYQLPSQDSDARFCGNLSESEETSLQWFDEARRQECLGRGVVSCVPFDNNSRFCHQCKEKVVPGEVIVMAPERFSNECLWHPQCFTCEKCNELLVDLIYFQDKNSVYCGRHHAELHKHRCAHCDELIFCDEYTEAEGRNWHLKHFICNRCDCQLGGQNYMVTSGLHYCMNCYHLASRCNTCRKYIIADKPHVTQGNIHWHADERCFCCGICERNLLGKKRYTLMDGMLLCGSEACTRSHELRRPPPPPSSSQKFCHLQRAGSLSSVPPGSSSPSLGSLTPSGSASPAHSDRPISRRKEYLQNLPPVQKSPSRVRFDLRPQQPILGTTVITDKQLRPKPPPSNPPPPPPANISNALTPPENIYETVIMPSQFSSSSSQEFNRNESIKRSKRRSKRKTTTNTQKIGEENNDYIVSSESSDSDNPTEALPSSSTGSSNKYQSTKVCSPLRSSSADCRYRGRGGGGEASRSCRRNNHYSNPPPEGCEKRCSSCSSSSSDSDGDDVYLSHYLAASLSRPESLKAQNKGKMSPFMGKKQQRHRAIPTIATPKTAKNKKSSNSNCIVS